MVYSFYLASSFTPAGSRPAVEAFLEYLNVYNNVLPAKHQLTYAISYRKLHISNHLN